MQSPLLQGLGQAYGWHADLVGMVTLCSQPSVDMTTLIIPQLIALHLKAGQRVVYRSPLPLDEQAMAQTVRRLGVDLNMAKAQGRFMVKTLLEGGEEKAASAHVLVLDGLWLSDDLEKVFSLIRTAEAKLIYAVVGEPETSPVARYLIHQSIACLSSLPLNSNLNRDLHGEMSLQRGGQTQPAELKYRSLLFKTTEQAMLFFPKGAIN